MNKGGLSALSKSQLFLYSSLAYMLGTGIASFCPEAIADRKIFFFAGAMASLAAISVFWREMPIRKAGILSLFLFLSFWRYGSSGPAGGPGKIWHYNGERAKIIGFVAEEPDERGNNTKLKIESEKLDGMRVSGKILVTAGTYPKYGYGDELEIECKLEAPEADDFPYDRYLARYDIYSVCFNPKMRMLRGGSEGRGNILYDWIFGFKSAVREKISRGLPEPEAGLAKGFILGDLKGIDGGLGEKFSRSGLSHIVAISGANISIVAALAMNLCFWLGADRKRSFYLSSAVLATYIIMVGAPASAMRAGLMGFLVLWALYLGRLNKSLNTISFAAAMMLFFNPKLLRDDIGFQLSFLAIVGVIYIYPSINRWLERIKIPNFLSVREAMGMTIAAQMLTIPVMVYDFGQVSAVAIPANILVSWTLPLLMMALPASILISFFIQAVPWLVFLVPDMILRYVISVAEWSSSVPFAFFRVDFKPYYVFFVISYYVFWSYFIYNQNKIKLLTKER